MRLSLILLGVAAIALIGGGLYSASHHGTTTPDAASTIAAAPAPLATPTGVTFQVARTGAMVLLATAGINIPAMATAYADAKGMTLYTTDNDIEPGKSTCAGDCAKAWPPLPAPADGKPFGDWSVVTRDDGSKQWALRGKPLYTSVKDTKLTDGLGNGADGVWHIALFKPGEGQKFPDGIAAQELANAAGVGLVNDQGMPLYVFDGDKPGQKPSCVGQPCADHWAAYQAAQLAKPFGDFTVIDRGDGIFQWAFQGRPLYSFDGDVDAGDANGNGLGGVWHVAMIRRNFMPADVRIARNHFGGDNYVDQAGMTLYVRDRVVGTNTGHNMRAGSRGNPIVGHILGAAVCDAECIKTWHPLVAPSDAEPSGYWEVVTRGDGTKQWTYRGYAVYLYAKDQKPGDMHGIDETQIMGETDPFVMADIGVKGEGALYWHAVAP